jgi:peptidoglycan biosynthesis protein MviN/MurJ (putative lipid II flippase)
VYFSPYIANNYFQSLGIVRPALVITTTFVVINAGLNWILIFGAFNWPGLGFAGSPLATSISRIGILTCYLLYMVLWKRHHERTWAGWTWAAFTCSRLKVLSCRAVSKSHVEHGYNTQEAPFSGTHIELGPLLFSQYWSSILVESVACMVLGVPQPGPPHVRWWCFGAVATTAYVLLCG